MSAPHAGCPSPRLVASCMIQNNSDDPVKVQIVYKGVGDHYETANVNIPTGETLRAEERLMDHGSFQTRKEIDSVEVTRADGQTHKLTAPFDGVHSIELDWLFIIDNSRLSSVPKNS